MKEAVLLFLAGGSGCLLRHLTMMWFGQYNTIIVNIVGSIAVGFLASYSNHPAITVGFLGGFTTFSAFSLQFHTIYQSNQLVAYAYILLSVIGGISGVVLGKMLHQYL